MLKEEKTICSRFLWLGLSHRKGHPFPEPIAFRPGSFVKRSQVFWLLVLGFLAVERGCIQRSSALGLFRFHRAIKRVTETPATLQPVTVGEWMVTSHCKKPRFWVWVSCFQPYNAHFANYITHIWHQKMLHIFNTFSCLERINGIFDKDDVKNVVVTDLDGKLVEKIF